VACASVAGLENTQIRIFFVPWRQIRIIRRSITNGSFARSYGPFPEALAKGKYTNDVKAWEISGLQFRAFHGQLFISQLSLVAAPPRWVLRGKQNTLNVTYYPQKV